MICSLIIPLVLLYYCIGTQCFAPKSVYNERRIIASSRSISHDDVDVDDDIPSSNNDITSSSRREILQNLSTTVSILTSPFIIPSISYAKCADIESCREEGERKVEADLKLNPIVKLSDGVRYRVLSSPTSPSTDKKVKDGSNIDLAYSISTASGQYMYSKGFGFEKVEFGGRQVSDKGLDSMRVVVGKSNVPKGIEYALIGMSKGEKRRVELPPIVGFETSNWQPEPTTRRGQVQIEQYKKKLAGFGSQPPFPAETVWDIEVLQVR